MDPDCPRASPLGRARDAGELGAWASGARLAASRSSSPAPDGCGLRAVAAKTLPVLGVPMESKLAGGLDSLLSMVQMPGGIPVGVLAVGKAGAVNAAILATQIVANRHEEYGEIKAHREDGVQVLASRILEDLSPDGS
jgi:hypothetical protein